YNCCTVTAFGTPPGAELQAVGAILGKFETHGSFQVATAMPVDDDEVWFSTQYRRVDELPHFFDRLVNLQAAQIQSVRRGLHDKGYFPARLRWRQFLRWLTNARRLSPFGQYPKVLQGDAQLKHAYLHFGGVFAAAIGDHLALFTQRQHIDSNSCFQVFPVC